MKFKITWILIRIGFVFWAAWVKFYQAMELSVFRRRFSDLEDSYSSLTSSVKLKENNIRFVWSTITNKLSWAADKWYMGFDAISDPRVFTYRTTGDCDDFANLALDILPNMIFYHGDAYYKDGFYMMNAGLFDIITSWFTKAKLPAGHAIAVWRTCSTDAKLKFIAFSNDECWTFNSPVEFANMMKTQGYTILLKMTKQYKFTSLEQVL